MARDIIDDRLIGALHVRALTRAGLAHDPAAEHVAFQAGTLSALIAGDFDGDTTLGELLQHGDTGIGTIAGLGGELIVVDSEAYLVDGEGEVSRPALDETTPFAVLCAFAPTAEFSIDTPTTLAEMRAQVDSIVDDPESIVAVRVDGTFTCVLVRSVHRQTPPYPPLVDVTDHQSEWRIEYVEGTVVGFRFPDRVAALDVPGHHLHLISADRRCGGHLLDLVVEHATVRLDVGDELHVELPDGVGLGAPGVADRAAIARAEGPKP